ncbi:MAG: S8 family serine peptidase, partial [Rhodospirillales bacterium]|nr:S8 family serine peptidase [Rhodospirillales bacterium]
MDKRRPNWISPAENLIAERPHTEAAPPASGAVYSLHYQTTEASGDIARSNIAPGNEAPQSNFAGFGSPPASTSLFTGKGGNFHHRPDSPDGDLSTGTGSDAPAWQAEQGGASPLSLLAPLLPYSHAVAQSGAGFNGLPGPLPAVIGAGDLAGETGGGPMQPLTRDRRPELSPDDGSGEVGRQAAFALSIAKVGFALAPPQGSIGIAPALIPGDPGFGNQWHLRNTSYAGVDLNVTDVWDQYTGQGVVVGIVDTGIDYYHSDLAPNYRTDLDYDSADGDNDSYASTTDDNHGTAVAGVIAAAVGGGDAVGVAPGADITGYRVSFEYGTDAQFETQLRNMANVDVANNSWGFTGFFEDNLRGSYASFGNALSYAASTGRGGLGTNIVFAAGNGWDYGEDVNYHGMQNSRHTIAVGGIEIDGDISSFSTPGAAVLVSGPATNVYTTDVSGGSGYEAGDYVSINGTSFAAPAVAGVVALMLEANPDLGYRDVQEILAYSSKNPRTSTSGWQTTGADDWNGGGLKFSHDYGYGLVDAHAAVRLAETWDRQSTEANVVAASFNNLTSTSTIADNATLTRTANISSDIDIQYVEAHLNISHTWVGDLRIDLISPDGTVSTLANQPANGGLTGGGSLDWNFGSVAHWGESSQGTWTLRIQDLATYDIGTLYDWDMTFYGDAQTADDTYIYTDQWSRYGGEAGRGTISDASGIDTLNFASLSTSITLDINAGAANTLLGQALNIDGATIIENAIGGDGGDTITGNASNNELEGWRGDDTLSGGGGSDTLTGGAGDDVIDGGADTDTAVFSGNYADYTVLADKGSLTVSALAGDQGTDTLTEIEFLQFADQTITAPTNEAPVTVADSGATSEDNSVIIDVLANDSDPDGDLLAITAASVSAGGGSVAIAGNQIVYDPGGSYQYLADGESAAVTLAYTVADVWGIEATADISVTVTGANDAPTSFSLDNTMVDEGSGGGTVVGNLGGVIDPDASDSGHSFTLIDDAGGRFELAGDQLLVAAGADLDFGAASSHSVTVRVHDAAGASHDQAFTVSLNDLLEGTGGQDTLIGTSAGDRLSGGRGADRLEGGGGDDIYRFERGDGADIIYDGYAYTGDVDQSVTYSHDIAVTWQETRRGSYTTRTPNYDGEGNIVSYNTATYYGNVAVTQAGTVTVTDSATLTVTDTITGDGGNDTLQFGAGIVAADILTQVDGDDFLIGVKADATDTFADLTDVIRLRDWFDANNEIETIRFDDGSVLDLSGVTPAGIGAAATSGDDAISGGGGSDLLEGGGGDDVYRFGRGDGADVIHDDYWTTQNTDQAFSYDTAQTYDYNTTVTDGPYSWSGTLTGTQTTAVTDTVSITQTLQADGGNDVLELGAGIGATDIRLAISGNDLLVGILDQSGVDQPFDSLSDVVRLQDWLDTDNRIETMRLADGSTLDLNGL